MRRELLAFALDLVALALLAHAQEVLLARAVLGDPLARELARLDLAQDGLHRLAGVVGDHPLAAREVAVLGRVGDRVAHPGDALLVHQVDDQLELVQALEVGQPRVVARVDERLVARADQLGDAAAEHCLLAEEVGLRLVLEARLDHAAAGAADALGVGEREVLGRARRVLGDRDQAGHAGALEVLAADEVAGALGGDQRHVDLRRGLDLAVVDREAVAEEQRVAGRDPVGDLLAVDLAVLLVGQQDHHDVAARGGLGDVEHLQPVCLGLLDRARVGAQSYDDADARVLEVLRVGVALRAVPDDGDGLAVEEREVRVVVVEHGDQPSDARAAARPQASATATHVLAGSSIVPSSRTKPWACSPTAALISSIAASSTPASEVWIRPDISDWVFQ